ncbi:MAG: hypothetical protein HY270_02415 [Deltaproteobacteria bacterium]|nr:hypothetical protein [Deltaproteobacteria bacterium]
MRQVSIRLRPQILTPAVVLAIVTALARPAVTQSSTAGFVGESRCANPTCHGAGLPASDAQRGSWRPWKSARTQWLNHNIDRHSDAYNVLDTPRAKAIADYMAVSATGSDKCLLCHAPAAILAPDSRFERKEGVSCEHCHGAAQEWLKPHVEKDWQQKKIDYAGKGFYDNSDFRKRAEKCATCHVEIDHEIVAGGHPPLQFEMVAYAQIMKHWDDLAGESPNAFSVDPTLWSIGQVVGLQHVMQMLVRRAGDSNYQGLGKFHGFEDKNCYQCHHKLLDDALRLGLGHYRMVTFIVAALLPARQSDISSQWNDVVAAVHTGAAQAEAKATRFVETLATISSQLSEHRLDQEGTRRILERLTDAGDELKQIKRFGYTRQPRSNVADIDNIGTPWWYTTGAPEQAILAIESLCEPALPGRCNGPKGIDTELRQLLTAANRFDYRPDAFAQALRAVHARLFR